MAKKPEVQGGEFLVSVRVACFYGDACPGDVVAVDVDEAARLVGLGVAEDAPQE